jgi:hypothetical protein
MVSAKHEVTKLSYYFKNLRMKKFLTFFSIVAVLAVIMTACNSGPRNGVDAYVTQPNTVKPLDTAGLAEFQAWKAQNELANAAQYRQMQYAAMAAPVAAPRAYAPARRATSTARRSTSPRYGSGTMSSSSSNTAMRKKGWSKAAKGAAIGTAGGAVLGAVINKKNRVVGGVIGGVLGGGVGYGIGRGMDKRDGRY